MKHFCKVLIAFCLFGFGITIQAQNSIPAAGGNATGAGGKESYTIGQIVYTTIQVPTGTITQGIQQPYEISVVTVIKEAADITLEISVYPNPASGFVNLKVEKYDSDNLRYKLIDMKGTLIHESKVDGNETQIQLGNILPGTYFLKVIDNKKEIKTFKIIKK